MARRRLLVGALLAAALGLAAPAPRSDPSWSDLLDPSGLVRRQLEQRLGRTVEFAEVTWQTSPPQVRVGTLTVGGEAPGDPPLLVAAAARLPVDPASLLDGVLVIDPLEAETARWAINDTVSLDLRSLAVRLEATSQEEPMKFRGGALLASGGRLHIEGSGRVGGRLDARLELVDVALAPVEKALPRVTRLSGLANGEIRFAGLPRRPEAVEADVALRNTRLVLKDITLERSLSLRAELRELVGPEGSGHARFDVDASLAALSIGGGAYRKAVGEPATVEGELVRDPDGQWRLASARLKVGPKAASPTR